MLKCLSCYGVLLSLLPVLVQSLFPIGGRPTNWEASKPPIFDSSSDALATASVRQKSMSEIMYPRRAVVNLDLPPRERWKDLITKYRTELIPFDDERSKALDSRKEIDQDAWVEALEKVTPDEYLEEARGILEVMNNPKSTWKLALLSDALYELGSPTACSQVLMAAKDGTVLHGRNLDYKLEAPIVEIVYLRDGKPLYTVPQFVGGVGLATVMKPGHWAAAQNTRLSADDTLDLTLKRVQAGAQLFNIVFRELADSNLEYDEVVAKLQQAILVRSSYFVVSGAGPFQGTIITRWWDPSFRHTEELTSTGKWYLVQTNDDNFGPPYDARRPSTIHALTQLKQSDVNPNKLINLMHNTSLFVSSTVFSFIMSTKSGKICTILGPVTKNDDTSVDCHMRAWKRTLPEDELAWTRWIE